MELTEYEASHKRQRHFRNIEQLFLHCSLERDYSRTGNVFLLKRRRKSLPFSWLVFNSLGLIFGTAFKEYWSPAMTLFTCERYWTDKRQSGAGRQQTCADKWRGEGEEITEEQWKRECGGEVWNRCVVFVGGGQPQPFTWMDVRYRWLESERRMEKIQTYVIWFTSYRGFYVVTLKPVYSRASDAFTVLRKTMLNL